MDQKTFKTFIIILVVCFTVSLASFLFFASRFKDVPVEPLAQPPISKENPLPPPEPVDQPVEYRNKVYGFAFALPKSWDGYEAILSGWQGNPTDPNDKTSRIDGTIVTLRNPNWRNDKPMQDIPIMVVKIGDWDLLMQDKYHVGAAPIQPTELGRNKNYVFALPARYNFAFLPGYEEVGAILEGKPLIAF